MIIFLSFDRKIDDLCVIRRGKTQHLMMSVFALAEFSCYNASYIVTPSNFHQRSSTARRVTH